MFVDLAIMAVVFAVGNLVFGHFESGTPLWRRWAKFALFMALTAFLSLTVGHLGVIAILSLGLVAGLVVHGWWLPKHGINGWTGEPREAYCRLRGWPYEE